MELIDVNEDCLIRVCRHLDAESIATLSQTCTWLKNVAERYFSLTKSYTCCIGSRQSMIIAARTIRRVGIHLIRLDLMFDLQFGLTHLLPQFFNVILQSVGPKLIELSVLGEICLMPLESLAPILCRLEELTLQNLCWGKECVLSIDLPYLCEKLRKLIVCGEIIFAPYGNKSFSRLESLDVVDFAADQIPTPVFNQNQQLTRLNLRHRRTTNNNINLNDLSQILVDLVKLHLDVQLMQNPIQDLPSLSNFVALRSLGLYSIPAASFNEILIILETQTLLTKIVLQCHFTRLDPQFSTVQESLPRLADKLKELETFVTVNIDWMEETVVEFVRNAPKLIYLDFWSGADSNYSVTTRFVRGLAAIRRTFVDAAMQPLHLKICAPNDDLRQVFNEPDVENIIKLSKLTITD